MSYGIGSNGLFTIKPLATIRNDVIERLKDYFGTDVDLTGMNPIVKFTEAISEEIYQEWTLQNEVFNSQFPQFSKGLLVDLHMNLRGLWRTEQLAASGTLVFVKNVSDSVTIPSSTSIDNNKGGAYYIEYTTDEAVIMSEVIQFTRGGGSTDLLSYQQDADKFFDAIGIDWVAEQANGNNPYTEGVDFVTYVSGDDAIEWGIGGTEPSEGDVYYVKFTGYSARIPVTCTTPGSNGNVNTNEIYHLGTPISGISSVTNDIAITNGSDRETDLQCIGRILKAPFPSVNKLAVESFLRNKPEVRGAKVIEHLGWFEPVVAFERTPVEQETYNRILTDLLNFKMVGAAPCHILEIIKGTVNGEDIFPLDTPYNNVYGVGFISDREDGFDPYEPGVDYLPYQTETDTINWSPAGGGTSEPSEDDKYYVQLVHALTLAYEVLIEVIGDVTLQTGATLSEVEDSVLDDEAAYFNALGITEDVYRERASAIITSQDDVLRLQNFKFSVILRVQRGEGVNVDDLPLEHGELITTVYVNSDEDGGGTEYSDYTISTGVPWQIDWSVSGNKPDETDFYFLKLEVDADILMQDKEIAKLTGVSLSSL